MTNEELDQIRHLLRTEIEPIKTAQAATDAKLDRLTSQVGGMDRKLDRVIERADDILTGVVRLRTEAENRDAGIRQEIDSLRERIEALEGRR